MKRFLHLLCAVVIAFLTPVLHAGHLKVSITPAPAISAGAQWRVDGGVWRNSGTTVKNLSNGTHLVEFKPVTAWIAPVPVSVTMSGGGTITRTGAYVQAASLTVSVNAGGEWRIDSGPWQVSGAMASGLSPGNHLVEYSVVTGYTTLPAETVSLAAGQSLSLARIYAAQARLGVLLFPNSAQWRVDGGAWRASGTSVNLDAGTYSIEYSHVVDYDDVPSESVTLSAGQVLNLTRAYVFTPATLSMQLEGENGEGRWRMDGGPWWPGNVSVSTPSGAHTLEYLDVPGYSAPATETITLAEAQVLSLSRSYTALPASLSVTLTPGTARWRVDGGAWQSSGAVLSIAAGPRSVEYEHLDFHLRPETETVSVVGATSISRAYNAGAGDLLVNSNPPLLGERGVAQWRLNNGPWNRCGERVGVTPGSYSLEFMPMNGLDIPAQSQVEVVAGELLELDADFAMPHRLRFFIQNDLTTGLSPAELQSRLGQYAAHLQYIWHRETARRFTFDPATDISVCIADPFSGSYGGGELPELGFEVWIYARLTDNPSTGTYGGNASFDTSGAGGASNLRWDQIYDPSTLQADTPEMMQYWRQIDHISHEVAHVFGAGIGEYYSLSTLPDPTNVAPILPTVSFGVPPPGDPFWGIRQEYWADPLLLNIYGQSRAGSPVSLPALLNTVSFAPATKGVINSLCRGSQANALPDLSHVRVRVVDGATGHLIPGATCRTWNRQANGTLGFFEQNVVGAAESGEFTFAWTPYPDASPATNLDNAKIVKAWAPGYTPAAQWESLYDAQKARVWDLSEEFVITIALNPE